MLTNKAFNHLFQFRPWTQILSQQFSSLNNMPSADEEEIAVKRKSLYAKNKKQIISSAKYEAHDVNFTKDTQFLFDLEKQVVKPRQVYKPIISKEYRQAIMQQEFLKFKEQYYAKAEKELQKDKKEKQSKLVDELWNGNPPIRYFEKVSSKDLYFEYRSPQFKQTIERKNNYLEHLNKPYDYKNGDLKTIIKAIKIESKDQFAKTYDPNFCLEEDYYQKQSNIVEQFDMLKKIASSINYQELPGIALSLAFELQYKVDVFKIWPIICNNIYEHIYHYTPLQLAQIKYALGSTFPKAGDYVIHNTLRTLMEEDLEKLSVEELLHANQAFRQDYNEQFNKKFIEQMIKKIPFCDAETIGNMFYNIASNLPKKAFQKKEKNLLKSNKRNQEILDAFEKKLKESVKDMSLDTMTRALIGLQLLRVQGCSDVLLRFEKRIQKDIDQIDAFQCAHILYALSKASNGGSLGDKETYEVLAIKVRQYWNDFENLDKSRIFFAYTSHNVIIEEDFNKLYLPWIKQQMKHFNYQELQNVAYGLMFTDTTDKQIWIDFVRNIANQPNIIPVINYYAIKQAKYFIKSYYPDWNLKPMDDASFEAENFLNVTRLQFSLREYEHTEFLKFMYNTFPDLDLVPVFYFQNLYLLEMVLQGPKIAFLLQTSQLTLPNGEPRPKLLLKQKILEGCDWKAIIISKEKLLDLNKIEKQEYMQKLLDEAMEEQKPKLEVWEKKRRNEIYQRLSNLYDRTITEGVPIEQPGDEKLMERIVK